jgi:hypothetical protein
MKKISTLIALLFITAVTGLYAQKIGDFKPKDDSFKAKKLNEGTKKLYIANFGINFEIYKEAIDEKKAGGFGRSVKNAAKAKAAAGLSTLEKEALQAEADKLFTEFVNGMESKGYEIISAGEAGKTATYDGWEMMTGPNIGETDMTGILSIVPTGYSFYYKERNAFSNQMAGFQKTSQNLSQELDDALIADISLIYAFSEIGDDWNVSNQAKVKLNINYRLASNYTFSDEDTKTSLSSLVDKSKQSVALSSQVIFTRGKLPVGGSAEAQYVGAMKSDLEISGVLEKDKVVAFSTQTQATASLQNPIVVIRGDNYSEKTKWLEPNGKKYAEGMYLAGSKFINYHVGEVFK